MDNLDCKEGSELNGTVVNGKRPVNTMLDARGILGIIPDAIYNSCKGNWRRLLKSAASEEELREFHKHERTGRVFGDDKFQNRLEKKLGRVLRRQKPGPKKR